jgi:hypothetical protein
MSELTDEELAKAAQEIHKEFRALFPGTAPASLDVTCAVQTTHDAGGIPVAVTDEVYWRYDHPPMGVKLFLLTKGGIAVTGNWSNDGRYLGWQYLFKRDKAKELLIE